MSEHNHPQDKTLSEVLQELKQEYLKKLPAHIAKLHLLTEQQDWLGLEEEYHKLKGTGKTYGYPEVSILCEKMEALAHHKDTQIIGLFKQAVELMDKIIATYHLGKNFDMNQDSVVKTIMKISTKPIGSL